MRLRPASIRDAALLHRWDEEPHVLESDPNDVWEWEFELERHPPWREQLIAEVDGVAIGFVQIIDPLEEDSHYWGEVEPNLRAVDIWIGEPQYLARGHGTAMMRIALERCFSRPEVEAVIIDPLAGNVRARRFYERVGFRPVGPRRFGQDDCVVYRLERLDWLSRKKWQQERGTEAGRRLPPAVVDGAEEETP